MTLSRVQAWFNRVPATDRDLPLLIADGYAYTPRQALEEVRRNTPTGARLQALIESGRYGTTPQEEAELAKRRLVEILRKYPPGKPVVGTLGGKAYTPEELIREIESETETGRRLIEAEKSRMQKLVRL
jgi:hypothetical protein